MPRELILEIIEAFGAGAATLKRIGYDMCMVHAATAGCSASSCPQSNRRTDEFGAALKTARGYWLWLWNPSAGTPELTFP